MFEFLAAHPVFTLSVAGSCIGTLFTYLAPEFTRDCLCADEYFCLGNLGINIFVHINVAHLIGNLFFMIPGALLCERFYNIPFVMTMIFLLAFIEGMMCIPRHSAACGYSAVGFMLCTMACLYQKTVAGFVILGILFFSSCIADATDSRTDSFAHKFGFVFGVVASVLYQAVV